MDDPGQKALDEYNAAVPAGLYFRIERPEADNPLGLYIFARYRVNSKGKLVRFDNTSPAPLEYALAALQRTVMGEVLAGRI